MPWEITAKSLTYKEKEGVFVAVGDVVIKRDGLLLYSQEATYNKYTEIVTLSGDVRLEAGGDILTGRRGFFDLKTQTGKIDKGCLFLRDNHYYINGEVMEKVAEDTYLIKDCQVTTCDGVNPAWSITGSEVKVTIEGYGKVRHATFRVRGLPLLYVPYMFFPAKTKRQTGLLPPRIGYSSRNGVTAEVPFFWAISDQTDATFYQGFMGKRGYTQGLEFRYLANEDSKGVFLFDILSDRREKKDMNDPDDLELSPYDRTNNTRYWLRSRADQDLPLGFVARLDTDFVSDQDYLRELRGGLFGFEARPDLAGESGRPFEEKYSTTRRSALRISRDGEKCAFQALASYHQRPDSPPEDETPQPVGGLNFMLLPDQVMDFPVFFCLESDYDYVWRDVGEKGHRVSLSPELKFPLWLADYVEFETSFRYSFIAQWFDDHSGGEESQSRGAYEAEGRLSTMAERIYALEGRNVKKLRHKVLPVVSYKYRAYQDEGDYCPWFEPIEEEGDVSLITLSLENYLDARLEDEKGSATYRQWATLNLSQGYDIDETRRHKEPGEKKKPFTPLSTELTVNPFPDFDLRAAAEWDHYDHRIASADLCLELSIDRSRDRKDTLKVDYKYERDSRKSLNLWLNANLIDGFSVGSSLERDLDLGQNISNSYWLEYESQCWGVKFVGEKEDEETRIMVLFRLLGLGDIKAW